MRHPSTPALFWCLIIVLLAFPAHALATSERVALDGAGSPAADTTETTEYLFMPVDEPAFTTHEPLYFTVGGMRDLNSRFQLSFKYRLLDPDSLPVEWFPPLAGMYLGYTQTSLWNIGAESAPFHDTSYRPSFFWQGASQGKGLTPNLLRGGFEHESNGKDGESSRSTNTIFAQPVWHTTFRDGRSLAFAPKFYLYLEKEDNADIQRYRGYADWVVRYGNEEGWILSTKLNIGTSGRGSGQFDLSYPLRRPLFARTGGFLHFQLFTGHGESLLDYNLDKDTQLRIGFSIVR
ncbi:phospholipase A [Chrysiogenes arsenatis]|uniref:phospholipase A n=1 Tax=Chrysiogenes arsenatis TaxID=309797 RepID=UPI00135F1BD5|nr:phospholipase A [Chrysiogenes arsenatis]